MKGLGIFGLISLLIVLCLSGYSCMILKEYDRAEQKQQERFLAAKAALVETGSPKDSAEGKPLGADRFEVWMKVRAPVAHVWREGLADQKLITVFMVRRLRNDSLQALADELARAKLSFVEYNQIGRRFRALLSLDAQADLREAWRDKVRTQTEPEGIELPPAPGNATAAEQALLRKHEADLRRDFQADLLVPQLELIEADPSG